MKILSLTQFYNYHLNDKLVRDNSARLKRIKLVKEHN